LRGVPNPGLALKIFNICRYWDFVYLRSLKGSQEG